MSESKMGRREALGKMLSGAAAVAGAALLPESRARAQAGTPETRETEIDTELNDYILNLTFETKEKKLELPSGEKKEMTPEVKQLAREIALYQRESIPESGREDSIARQKELWKKIIKFFPEHQKEYSRKDFAVLMFELLPDFFAQYGVLLEVQPMIKYAEADRKISHVDFIFLFLEYSNLRKENLIFKGKEIERTLVDVTSLKIEGEDVLPDASGTGAGAQFYRRNLVIFKDNIAANEALKPMRDEYPSEQKIYSDTAAASGEMQEKMAALASYIFFWRENYMNGEYKAGDTMDETISHESGHLVHATPEFAQPMDFRPIKLRTREDFENWSAMMVGMDEVYAKLIAIMLSRNKLLAFSAITAPRVSRNLGGATAMAYEMSDQILRQSMKQEILKDPDYYGVSVDLNSSITPGNQVVMQFIKIAKNPEKLNHLCDVVFEKVRTGDIGSPDEPLVAAKVKGGGAQDDKTGKTVMPWGPEKIAEIIGAGGAVAMGVWLGFKKFIQRKGEVAKAESEPVEKRSEAGKSKKTKGKKGR